MKKQFNLILLFLLLLGGTVYSQISTDRPSMSESTSLLEKGKTQLETGFSSKDYFSLSVRGGISKYVEVRFSTTDKLEKSYGNLGTRIRLNKSNSLLIEKDIFSSEHIATIKYLKDFNLTLSDIITVNLNYVLNKNVQIPQYTLCYTRAYCSGGFSVEVYNTDIQNFSDNSGVLGCIYIFLLDNVQLDVSTSYSKVNSVEHQIGLSIQI